MHALSTGRPDGAHDTRVTSASEDNEDAPQLQARGVGCYVMGGGKRGEEAACVGELTVGAGVVMRSCRAAPLSCRGGLERSDTTLHK